MDADGVGGKGRIDPSAAGAGWPDEGAAAFCCATAPCGAKSSRTHAAVGMAIMERFDLIVIGSTSVRAPFVTWIFRIYDLDSLH